ncbi:outer membrane protein [Legionella dresdenensis]|uniref:Outer membrane protein n=1 Tax=Legionella dresdenensis TaxID=450200 RepID=A0ABV8CEJ3_9GAMM
MLRKTKLLSIISLLITTPSFAGTYLGAGIGPEGARFTQRAHVVRTGTFDVIDKQHFAGVGVFGSLFAGYGWQHEQYYLAAELNANLSTLEYKLKNIEYVHGTASATTFSVKSSEGVSLLPGYFLTKNFLGYARIGYSNGRVKINESDPTIKSAKTNRGGVRYGLGIRYNWVERWTLMMDYSQINYRGIKSLVFEPIGGVSKSAKISPATGQVAFGVLYSFDDTKQVKP